MPAYASKLEGKNLMLELTVWDMDDFRPKCYLCNSIYTSHFKLSTGLFTQRVDSSRQKALFFLLCGNQWWNLKQQCVSEPVSTGSVHEGLGDLVTARDNKCKFAVIVQACWRHKMWKMKKSFFPCKSSLSSEFYAPSFGFVRAGLVTVSPLLTMPPRRNMRVHVNCA